MANPWFRLYSEAVDDFKLRLLAFEDRWHFVALLCCKCQGLLDQDNDQMVRRAVAVKLGLDLRELDEVARRLAEVDLIDRETLQPLAWGERQFQSDSSTERVQKWRERQKKQRGNGVKRSSNVAVTAQETDTDTDKDKNTRSSAAAPDRFADFWDVYPKKVKKQDAKKKWKARKLDQKADEIIADVKARQAKDGRWLEGFVPDPTTYINGSRWEDALEAPRRNGSSKPEWAQIPRSDDDLWPWAKRHGYPNPGSLNYYQYRQTLQRAVEQRLNQ